MANKVGSAQRVQQAFPRLGEVAKILNEKSDKLGANISVLEAKLKKLNLGVTSWVIFHSERGDEGSYHEEIGYTRINGRWGIAIRTISADFSDPQSEVREWLFNDASRTLRLRSVAKIPELLEQLIEDANELAKSIDEKSVEVAALASALEETPSEEW